MATLYDIKPAPFQKFAQRLQLFRAPTLSIVARCTCFNTYIVSVMPYTASYFGLCTTDLNLLRQQAVKFLLKRHWLESEILPYVLRLVGIAPVLDPALVATVAATGLYFREGNTLEDLINMNLLPDGCNLRQRSVVHDLLQFWAPSVKLPEIHAALANRGGGLKGRLCRLKSTIYAGMALAAKTRLRKHVIYSRMNCIRLFLVTCSLLCRRVCFLASPRLPPLFYDTSVSLDKCPHSTDRCPYQIKISFRNFLVSRLSKPNPQPESAAVREVSPPFPHCQKESACFAFSFWIFKLNCT